MQTWPSIRFAKSGAQYTGSLPGRALVLRAFALFNGRCALSGADIENCILCQAENAVWVESVAEGLFQLGFFVNHVLAGNRIEFFDFEFAGGGPLIFSGGVEMASAGAGFQLDFIAHDSKFLK